MSEFKFACPVCGQHITANSDSTGSQLECPTCFRKIVVPQAPASADPKFILSASEANRPRPPQAIRSTPESLSPPVQRASVPWAWIIPALVVGILGASLFFMRGRVFSTGPAGDGLDTNALTTASGPTNRLPWTLDVDKMEIPEGIVAGRIRGQDFVCDRAIIQGGSFTVRHGRSGTTDLGLSINFFASQPEALAGRTIIITTNNTGPPRIVVRWKEENQAATANITENYALKLRFGPLTPSGIQGEMYLCLSDPEKTRIAGTFNAEIRRPAQRPPRRQE